MKQWAHGVWAVFLKELQLELRNRYGINQVLMFVVGTVFVISIAAGRADPGEALLAGLLWVVILFAASLGLARTFVAEEDRGTTLFLRLHTTGTQVFAGKLGYNILLLIAAAAVAVACFVFLTDLNVAHGGLLGATLLLGAIGLAGATTLLSAVISRSERGAALLPVLLFPVLLPLLIAAVNATGSALDVAGTWETAAGDLTTMFSFSGVMITAAVLLFDYVWTD